MIRKYLQKIFKKISYGFFLKIHGPIKNSIGKYDDKRIKVKVINTEEELKYNVYSITDGRLYTDRIHDSAVILDNRIIEGPSFQLRELSDTIVNSKISDNIVFSKGTPRKLIKLNGSVLSLLTGGAGNNNYWHWLFDVLPRFGLCNKSTNLSEIDYFLLPSLLKQYQKESLDCLNIPNHKRISSEKFRHVKAKELIVTDHPVVVSGNATKDILNIPSWLISWLRDNFMNQEATINNKIKNKIYIDRGDISLNNLPQRFISNDDEVKKCMLDNNFITVKLHKMEFRKQVDLFHNAECIVGLHGAGFGNIVFCKPGTKIIELKSLTSGDAIKNLAKKNDLNYSSIEVEAKQIHKFNFPNQQGSIQIPINNLIKTLGN